MFLPLKDVVRRNSMHFLRMSQRMLLLTMKIPYQPIFGDVDLANDTRGICLAFIILNHLDSSRRYY